jgi:hypothetical protein
MRFEGFAEARPPELGLNLSPNMSVAFERHPNMLGVRKEVGG